MIRNVYPVFLLFFTYSFCLFAQEQGNVYNWQGEKIRYDLPLARANKSYDQGAYISLSTSFLQKKLGALTIEKVHVIDSGLLIPVSLDVTFKTSRFSNPDRFVIKVDVHGRVKEKTFISLLLSLHVSDTLGENKSVRLPLGNISINTYESLALREEDTQQKTSEKIIDDVKITPNPFTQGAYISFESRTSNPLSLTVYDILGNQVYAKIIKPSFGFNRIWFTPRLSRGLYIYKVESDKFSITKRFVIN